MIKLSDTDTFEDAKRLHQTINKALEAVEWEWDEGALSEALISALNELRRKNMMRADSLKR